MGFFCQWVKSPTSKTLVAAGAVKENVWSNFEPTFRAIGVAVWPGRRKESSGRNQETGWGRGIARRRTFLKSAGYHAAGGEILISAATVCLYSVLSEPS
jgi:hypothetical protein